MKKGTTTLHVYDVLFDCVTCVVDDVLTTSVGIPACDVVTSGRGSFQAANSSTKTKCRRHTEEFRFVLHRI